jgi:branched-chain amino acid transport system permease protein
MAAALLLVVLPLIPGLDSNFSRSLLTQMGIAAVFALSYNLLLGQTGLLSFGHAVYFGLGGYAAIHFLRAVNGGLPVPLPFVPLAGAAAGLLFGILFGALTTRRAGTIFALISLGVGELVHAASLMLPGFFGGEEGVTASRTKAPHWLGLDFGSQLQVYYVIAFWLLIATLAMHAFMRTPAGRMCNAVRDNPERAEFIGYNPQRVRFVVFAVAAMFAGLAGGLHAINYEIVAAEAVGATRSGVVLLMAYIGGVHHFIGPILGAIAITWLQVSLSDYTTAWLLYLGLFFMAIVLYVPGGLAGLVTMHIPFLRARAMGRVLRVYALALGPVLAMTLGAVILIEMAYRRSTQPEAGARMKLFWISMDTSTPWPWLGAALLAAAGYASWRWVSPRVAAAWSEASEEARLGAARG